MIVTGSKQCGLTLPLDSSGGVTMSHHVPLLPCLGLNAARFRMTPHFLDLLLILLGVALGLLLLPGSGE